jgi:hypothetical protein
MAVFHHAGLYFDRISFNCKIHIDLSKLSFPDLIGEPTLFCWGGDCLEKPDYDK